MVLSLSFVQQCQSFTPPEGTLTTPAVPLHLGWDWAKQKPLGSLGHQQGGWRQDNAEQHNTFPVKHVPGVLKVTVLDANCVTLAKHTVHVRQRLHIAASTCTLQTHTLSSTVSVDCIWTYLWLRQWCRLTFMPRITQTLSLSAVHYHLHIPSRHIANMIIQ